MANETVIIETEEQWNSFKQAFWDAKSTEVLPILSDAHQHPLINTISVLMVRIGETLFVLPVNHTEALSMPWVRLNDLWTGTVYTPSKKLLLQILPTLADYIHDVNGWMYLDPYRSVVDPEKYYPPAMQQMLSRFHNKDNVIRSVPLMTLIEFTEAYLGQMNYKPPPRESRVFFTMIEIPALTFLESSGLHVDEEKYIERFGDRERRFVRDGLVYPQYNPYTTTGRVSCKQFLALNKSDGTREAFTSRFGESGRMVLIDYESFHVRLIGHLMGYELPPTSLHTYFGKQYFGVEELTSEQYEESKRITFTLQYSDEKVDGIPDYFLKVQEYRATLWEEYQKAGYIKSPNGRIIHDIEGASPAKLFNYLVQLTETEVALAAINALIPLFATTRSKVVLYTYDSLLIDFHVEDGKELLSKTREVLSWNGRFPVKTYFGKSYGSMVACK